MIFAAYYYYCPLSNGNEDYMRVRRDLAQFITTRDGLAVTQAYPLMLLAFDDDVKKLVEATEKDGMYNSECHLIMAANLYNRTIIFTYTSGTYGPKTETILPLRASVVNPPEAIRLAAIVSYHWFWMKPKGVACQFSIMDKP